MEQGFLPREVYVASSFMAPVGRYNGKEREALSFLEMAEKAGEVFSTSRLRRLPEKTAPARSAISRKLSDSRSLPL